MASLQSSLMFLRSRFVLLIFLLSFLLRLQPFLCTGERHLSSACSPPRDPLKLGVVHRFGPCSPFNTSRTPSPDQIFKQDQARVDWIQRRVSGRRDHGVDDSLLDPEAANLPTHINGNLGTGNYFVTAGFGTPRKDLFVILDTGSDLTWIKCKNSRFNPAESSTYSGISCSSDECNRLSSHLSCSSNSTCRYEVQYADDSKALGDYSRDTLTLGSDVLLGFMFGCSDQSSDEFGKVDGLMGLSRGGSSLVSQASSKYGAVFSYCLPSSLDSAGFLTLGNGRAPPSRTKYTPLLSPEPSSEFYYVDLVGIKVGGKLLSIPKAVFSKAGALMDSGTVVSRLPPDAYDALKKSFSQQMSAKYNYTAAKGVSILQDCYDLSGYKKQKATVPAVTLVFRGGATLDVDFGGILYVFDLAHACLAFAPNEKDTDVAIIGNVQQRRFQVTYDISNKQIGFAPNAC